MKGRARTISPTVVVALAGGLAIGSACMDGDRRLAVQHGDAGLGTAFGAPVLVAGLTSAPTDTVQDPTLTADELEIYFTSPAAGDNDIWRAARGDVALPWSGGALVTELSSPTIDQDPDLSPDGLTITFSSDRGERAGLMRLWTARRAARTQPWSSPELVAIPGSSNADVAPSLDATGLTLAFASLRAAGDFHLFLATRTTTAAPWGAPEELAALNSSWQDRDPVLFRKGAAIVFGSRRSGGGRTADLFEASRHPGDRLFTDAPTALVELNTDTWEGDPWLSADGSHIMFVSDRNGTSRIYEARR